MFEIVVCMHMFIRSHDMHVCKLNCFVIVLRITTTGDKSESECGISLEKVWKWQCFDFEFLDRLKMIRGL